MRDAFPAVLTCTYLNTAAGAPISQASAAAGRDYYEASFRDGDVHWDTWLGRVENARDSAAGWLGASADEIGFVGNASAAVNLVAGMLRGRGDVLAVSDDFPSVTLPWLQLGYSVQFVDPGPHGGATIESLAHAVTPETKILALGLVHYRTGYRYDLAALGEFCRDHGLLLVVDATQGLGAVAVDVSGGQVDFLVSSTYKWLTGGYGVSLLYVNRRHLDPRRFPAVGYRSAREPFDLVADRLDLAAKASALELGHPPFPAVFALSTALDLLHQLGAEAVETRVLGLNQTLRERLAALGADIAVDLDSAHRSGIVYFPVDDAAAARAALAERGVLVSARGAGLRVSAHMYNNRADIDRLIEGLEQIL